MIRWMIPLVALAASTAGAQSINPADLPMPVETRAIWIDAGAIPKTESSVREMVRTYRAANLNTLFPETIARGYAIYESDYVQRDPRFEAAPDVLAIMIDEAHKLNMEVHPWVWVFRAGYTQDIGSILRAHPDWAAVNKKGETLSASGGYWISACNPAARDFLAGLLAEVVSRYNVDGLHLDYIRYETEKPVPFDYSRECRGQFKQEYGIDPADIERLSFHQLEWNKFRERQINTFVQRAALQTRAIRPDVKISAAVASDPVAARLSLMQNWPNWADNKWVDFITPMAYTRSNDGFATMLCSEKAAVGCKTLLAPGVGSFLHEDPQQTVQQIATARDMLASGQSLFAASYFSRELGNALRAGPYSDRAAAPYRDPWDKSLELFDYGMRFRCDGELELADFYCGSAAVLANYAKYQQQEIAYIPPTPPPLNIPESVLPLPTVDVPRATSLVVIDGKLDDPAWNSAAQVGLSYTDQGLPAPVDTIAYLTYDQANLYVGFLCQEPQMGDVQATVQDRDGAVFYEDSVEVFVDPTDERESYYHFAVNTLGTQFDEKVTNAGWNGAWEAATKTEPEAWTAEIAIPFETLGVLMPDSGRKWALNLTRNRMATGEMQYMTWAVPYGSFHSPDRFGTVVFE